MNCTIRVAKTKALISFAVTATLICVFVFAYADCWFSHEAAQILYRLGLDIRTSKKVQIGNDQEKAQAERNSYSKNRGGKN